MSQLRIVPKGHPVNVWWLMLFCKPYVAIDGDEFRLRWFRKQTIQRPAGVFEVETFIRYRGIRRRLGIGSCTLELPPAAWVLMISRNGVLNGSSFTPEIVQRGAL